MRTKNLMLSIVLIALTVSASGQFSSFRDRVLPNKEQQSPFITAEYTSRTSQLKAFLDDIFTPGREELDRDATSGPVVLECYLIDNVEISYQEEGYVENWMIEPFESSETLELESWMTEPFERDDALAMENWMTVPFETGEMIEVEEWMATSWQ